ncbi:MAG: type II toxin-antitoxin system RelE/ParE family toxin [Nanoarchaeota archaeon]
MTYRILLDEKADKFLQKLQQTDQQKIRNKLRDLAHSPQLGKPLVGRLSGLWSLRTGDYRAIYQIRNNELLIFVLQIGHRKNIYS